MKTSVEALEGNKVKLSVEVDEQEFESAVDAAFKKIARDVRIPGFRPGKAPRRVLESHIGAGAGRAQALNDALPDYYSEAVLANEVDVIAPPDIELVEGSESGNVKFDAIVEVRPVISISGYKTLTVEIPSPSPSDEEIDAQLERFRNQYGDLEFVERAADTGDYVTIDIEGSQNDEVLEGLVASAYLYEVGSAGIVPELDEQLVGVSAGDTRSFDAAHPNGEEEDPLHFEVTVTEVKAKVLPELNDEFAAQASEFETMAAWRDDIVTRMTEVRKAQSQMIVREKIGEALAELVPDELPEPLIAAEMNERLQDMAMRLQAQGLSLDQWLQFSGTDTEQFLDELKTTADRSARVDLALRAIALAEAIEVLEEDLDLEFEAVAARVEQDSDVVRIQLTEAGHIPALKVDIAKRKSLDWLTESVTITDDAGNSITFSDLAASDEDDGDTVLDTPASEEDESE
ncbi:MAG: trigger factor [Actinobacteria bacterium]|uniref:peptidylprolyl isomerase n=3 Tax=freshwater metagenome TaxID=449393 RepID=A0A6J7KDT8_9ZZZZ|nr:trigger factor [Actinomycetota bacterium]MSX33773.1 trigger factor [Actinomycetota bacterium]MSY25281.1 trigger factor [Actinomycetota bacterium]MSY34383.1 trigger factor [Actinomycetota bacterium]MSZ52043.1 trigger factor [Actinomycetota bacterium]